MGGSIARPARVRFEHHGPSLSFGPTGFSAWHLVWVRRRTRRSCARMRSTSDGRLELVLSHDDGACHTGDIGDYTWTRAGGHASLTSGRARTPARPVGGGARRLGSCRLQGRPDGCLGDVKAGDVLVPVHRSAPAHGRHGEPRIWQPRFGALTYTVPEGWANRRTGRTHSPDADGRLRLETARDRLTVSTRSPSLVSTRRPRPERGLHEPGGHVCSPDGRRSHRLGQAPTPLARSKAHPQITIDGLHGRYVDVRLAERLDRTVPGRAAGRVVPDKAVAANDDWGWGIRDPSAGSSSWTSATATTS